MSLITISQVNCKDCYKCVRYCPVKAIRVVNGHAEVVPERCLGDGSCIQVCPQQAKHVRNDDDIVRNLLAGDAPVMASVAPSVAGVYGTELPQLLAALKQMGFARVEETARTAAAVARAHAELAAQGKSVITTSCPAVVSLVEKYYPHLRPMLAPVPSPMVAHARLLREEYGPETGVVFIGPCVAKKGEVAQDEINAALTFDELNSWLDEEMPDWHSLAGAEFDNAPVGTAELFPLLNGLIKTAGLPDDNMNEALLTVAGLPEVRQLFDELPTLEGVHLIEALACAGGCLQGPGAICGPEPWTRRKQLLAHARPGEELSCPANMSCTFTDPPLNLLVPTEEEIAAILRRTGKHTPTDEQNCGACGYNSCREKAIAVIQGMAEAEMCIPYMRSRAESFANVVIRNTPNGIIVVDSQLRVLDINPAFTHMFNCLATEVIGRPLKSVFDPAAFARVKRTGKPFSRTEVKYGDMIASEMVFPVADEGIIIGIYININEEVLRQQKQLNVKSETLGKARQVIDKQMRVAQEIAGLLGETTAETKVLLTRLISLYDEEK